MNEPSRRRLLRHENASQATQASLSSHRSPGRAFTRDFLTGCLALAAVAVIGLLLVPLLIIVFKLSALLIVPLALLAIFVILTAFLGRIINLLRENWPQSDG